MTWTVLVVDDEEDIRESLVDVLSARGYRALAARDGKVAWELLESGDLRPSVILLDLMMPVMDGWTFLERQAATPALRGIPVIVLSAASGLGELPGPVAANLNKPVRLKTLLSAVEAACQSSGAHAVAEASASPARVALGTGSMMPVTGHDSGAVMQPVMAMAAAPAIASESISDRPAPAMADAAAPAVGDPPAGASGGGFEPQD